MQCSNFSTSPENKVRNDIALGRNKAEEMVFVGVAAEVILASYLSPSRVPTPKFGKRLRPRIHSTTPGREAPSPPAFQFIPTQDPQSQLPKSSPALKEISNEEHDLRTMSIIASCLSPSRVPTPEFGKWLSENLHLRVEKIGALHYGTDFGILRPERHTGRQTGSPPYLRCFFNSLCETKVKKLVSSVVIADDDAIAHTLAVYCHA
ncbi:hypothetical protein SBOR_9064 [Sclerotinia borealis F-4128]|uniref:Uncharacterized protein n=1 Tax=Sclerotinia borealis (strain F-4128) TaxID=1432307 RepID=W9C181_SCLBF|nr:hypothetical protein SBOR_9064 [Sclerotinia borealis F-4128]